MRTRPSTLRNIEDLGKTEKLHGIYRSLSTRPCKTSHIPVTHPRNTRQCRNTVKNFNHDELYSVYEISSSLDTFAWSITLNPKCRMIFGLELLGDELIRLVEEETETTVTPCS